ncbi:DNA gyrase inhibitor YacG [Azospirillum halopraeferens]|uniref:DNA gyrase inhibitor YacG n=1 Tax=Azospirillum halopraeferens TaxID=34010 RepID=UPI00041DD60B|nr:DNA gyrase inhibitor YacG [Azospirillum halopraeferens]
MSDTATSKGAACPICGRPAAAPFRPFCSKRCADVDLARWLGGVYRVETDDPPEEPGADPRNDDI